MNETAQARLFPMKVYGSDISYFTGKLEMYLRAKGIPYEFVPLNMVRAAPVIRRETGNTQMPAATLADGRWMTDTTPMIDWLEQQRPAPPIIPTDPELRFYSLLLEDYADEWLWRPAMHYRWYTDEGAMFASRHLCDELTAGLYLPKIVKRWMLRRRQRGYTTGDGVTEQNREQVETVYLNNLRWMSTVLQKQPFLLGKSPSLVDIAFSGPMFRHFAQDPVPAEIMRLQAPSVYEWIARLWNIDPATVTGDWQSEISEDWTPWLQDIGSNYLPYLCENALARARGKERFTATVNGVTYVNARASRYRVWCIAQLREAFNGLPAEAKARVEARLARDGCWEPLWRDVPMDEGVNENFNPPFGTNVKALI